ncbi:MAG: hypothetical protein R3C56_01975 [Pirellulaceae bacterium]
MGDPVTAVAAGTAVNDTAFNDTVQPHQSHSPYPSDTSDAPPPAAQVERATTNRRIRHTPISRSRQRRHRAKKRVETKLIQFEFEQILQLPPTALAQLLSSTDSQTVLIALSAA